MTDSEFLDRCVASGILTWKDNYPWSGYHIKDTCLILRQSQRPNYYTNKFYWDISTYAFTIVVKEIEDGQLAEDWPKDLAKLSIEGEAHNERFRDTPDF